MQPIDARHPSVAAVDIPLDGLTQTILPGVLGLPSRQLMEAAVVHSQFHDLAYSQSTPTLGTGPEFLLTPVTSFLADALAVFSRDPASGGLTFVQVLKDTDPGVDGLWGANSVAISPDGGHVYVASRKDDALAVFDRDGTSGALTYRGAIRNIDPGVDGLNGARTVVVSPNGDYVYVVSQYDDALACFSRNQTSGGLSFVQVIKDTDPGVDGLNTANGLAISPSGGHLYVAGYDDDAVAVFAHPFALYLPLIIRD